MKRLKITSASVVLLSLLFFGSSVSADSEGLIKYRKSTFLQSSIICRVFFLTLFDRNSDWTTRIFPSKSDRKIVFFQQKSGVGGYFFRSNLQFPVGIPITFFIFGISKEKKTSTIFENIFGFYVFFNHISKKNVNQYFLMI